MRLKLTQLHKFGDDFAIDDNVLEALISRPALCARLTTFIAGDPDTGNGTQVSEATFIRFIKRCSNMRLLLLDSHLSLGEEALLAIMQACPKLEALRITGHDRGHGAINEQALLALAAACEADSSLAVKLRDLILYDQSVYEKSIKKLQKVRHLIIIRTGDTPRQHAYAKDGDFYAYKGGKMSFARAVQETKYQWY